MNYKFFTSESAASGHPDKICDQISDAILDACLAQDPYSHTAVECLATVDHLTLAGEIKSRSCVDYIKIARRIIQESGYNNHLYNFSYESPIESHIHQQSADIAAGVEEGGAGDQGMMFGYATSETAEFIPLPITLAHRLVECLDMVRVKKILPYLRPDGKSEVKVGYEKGIPKSVVKIVLAVPHDPGVTNGELKKDLQKNVVLPILKNTALIVRLKI